MHRLTQLTRFALITLALGSSISSLAQAVKSGAQHIDSRVDVYGGYGFFDPINSGINGYQYQKVYNPNATVSVSAFFNHYVGIQIEGGYFSGTTQHAKYGPCSGETCSQLIYTAEAGPVLRLPLGHFVPFVHFLGGGERTNGPAQQSLMWGWGVTGGAGLDITVPAFNYRFAIRPIQADFQYSQVVYGPLLLPAGKQGGFGEIDNLKLSGGIVARFGNVEPPYPVMLGCGAQPSTVFPGDPIKIQSNALHLNPKKKATYTWAANGGKIIPSGAEATVDTAGLAPGEYVVTGHVEEGSKARQQASCAAPFTVKQFEPPTITCSASPSTAVSGTDIDISTAGSSPQNRPLTYSYTATAGVITSSGPTAKLSTAGLSASTITITCNVVDDLGQAAKATTDVVITTPPVPVVPQTQQLCSINFDRDKRRPVRVDNEAKGCLDDIALTLNQQTDARLVMVGNETSSEKPTSAAERTLNARQYLTQEKGIDPSRIELRTGADANKSVTNTLVPAGAIFNELNTQTFDEKSIVRHGQAYGIPKAKTTKGKEHVKVSSDHAATPAVLPAPASTPTSTPAEKTAPSAPVIAPTTPTATTPVQTMPGATPNSSTPTSPSTAPSDTPGKKVPTAVPVNINAPDPSDAHPANAAPAPTQVPSTSPNDASRTPTTPASNPQSDATGSKPQSK
jgi:hypothetical protein